MDAITTTFLLILATAVVTVTMVLSGLLLLGWRTGRLKAFNVIVVFAIAFVAFCEYRRRVTEEFDVRLLTAAWVVLALVSLWGLVGVLLIARSEPPVWSRHKQR